MRSGLDQQIEILDSRIAPVHRSESDRPLRSRRRTSLLHCLAHQHAFHLRLGNRNPPHFQSPGGFRYGWRSNRLLADVARENIALANVRLQVQRLAKKLVISGPCHRSTDQALALDSPLDSHEETRQRRCQSHLCCGFPSYRPHRVSLPRSSVWTSTPDSNRIFVSVFESCSLAPEDSQRIIKTPSPIVPRDTIRGQQRSSFNTSPSSPGTPVQAPRAAFPPGPPAIGTNRRNAAPP